MIPYEEFRWSSPITDTKPSFSTVNTESLTTSKSVWQKLATIRHGSLHLFRRQAVNQGEVPPEVCHTTGHLSTVSTPRQSCVDGAVVGERVGRAESASTYVTAD